MKQSLLPLICIALIAGCGTNPKEKTSASADHMQHRIERNEVTVDTLRRRDFVRELISNGRLIAAKRSTLSFPVTGTIVAIHAGNGEGVNRGAVIARIDTTEYAVQLHKSQLALDKSRLEFYDVLSRRRYDQRSGRGIATGTHPFGLCRCLGVAAKRSQKSRTMLVMRTIFR
jgi:membrane fusion protein (multidrug efflux system)